MRKISKVGVVCLLTLSLLGCSGKTASVSYEYTEESGNYKTTTEAATFLLNTQEWGSSNDRNIAVQRLEEAAKKAQSFVGEQAQNKEVECRIQVGSGVSQVAENGIDIYFYQTIEQPYVNLMIQAFMGTQAPDYLREGLGAYGAMQQGESPLDFYAASVPELKGLQTPEETDQKNENSSQAQTASASLTEMAQQLHQSGQYEKAEELGDLFKAISQLQTGEEAEIYRGVYCIYAASFVEYLVETKGLEAVFNLYQSGDFQASMGKDMATMRQSWQNEVLNK